MVNLTGRRCAQLQADGSEGFGFEPLPQSTPFLLWKVVGVQTLSLMDISSTIGGTENQNASPPTLLVPVVQCVNVERSSLLPHFLVFLDSCGENKTKQNKKHWPTFGVRHSGIASLENSEAITILLVPYRRIG